MSMSTDLSALDVLTTYIAAFSEVPNPSELAIFSDSRDDLLSMDYTQAKAIIDLYTDKLNSVRERLKSGKYEFSMSKKHLVRLLSTESNTDDIQFDSDMVDSDGIDVADDDTDLCSSSDDGLNQPTTQPEQTTLPTSFVEPITKMMNEMKEMVVELRSDPKLKDTQSDLRCGLNDTQNDDEWPSDEDTDDTYETKEIHHDDYDVDPVKGNQVRSEKKEARYTEVAEPILKKEMEQQQYDGCLGSVWNLLGPPPTACLTCSDNK